MKKIDRVASCVIIITALLLIGVILIGTRVPINIACQYPTPCDQVSPFGSILFEFSRPVQADQVENLWKTTPTLEGKWEWLDGQHARWYSLKPLPPNQKVTLQFNPGQAGQNGELISSLNHWEVKVRSPRIIVAEDTQGSQELFTYGLEDGAIGKQLPRQKSNVYDFQASPDGESVIYSAINDLKGIDLWIIQRDGSNQRKLLDCGRDRCSTPSWSSNLQELAYTREGAGLDPNGPYGVPRIWIVDVRSGQTVPLFADAQKIGYGPKWSPDGQWLSIWNGLQGGIQVVNRKTGETYLLNSSSGDVGCWTQDSQFLYYSNTVAGDAGFRNVVLKADISKRLISTILGGNVTGDGFSINNPICSPTEKWVAVTIQPDAKIPGRNLFLLNPEAKDGITITDDISKFPSYYSWTPDGNRLVFQINSFGGKVNGEEIWVWDRTTGQSKKIAEGARSPQWLP
jgi:Tol biopolymer transport system component